MSIAGDPGTHRSAANRVFDAAIVALQLHAYARYLGERVKALKEGFQRLIDANDQLRLLCRQFICGTSKPRLTPVVREVGCAWLSCGGTAVAERVELGAVV